MNLFILSNENSNQSKLEIFTGNDGESIVKDESNIRLEQRLKIKDLEMLKHAFDVIFFFNFF